MGAVGQGRGDRRRRGFAAGAFVLAGVLAAGGTPIAAASGGSGFGARKVDGVQTATGVLLPSDQMIAPLGVRHLVTNGRLLSSALSPDGVDLAALTYEHGVGFLTIMDVATGRIVQQLGTGVAGDPKIGDGKVAADGPLYSPDGRTLWFPQATDVVRFTVGADGHAGSPEVIALPGKRSAALPSGMALSADGRTLYVALNGNDTLGVVDTATGTLTAQIPVGVAPRQVVVAGGEAFVSDEGGRRASRGDFTNRSYGTLVVADRGTGAAATGVVSVVDLAAGVQRKTIKVGLQPTALYLHGTTLMVADTGSDSISLIDTSRHRVTQTVNLQPLPGATVGSSPNAIAMPDDRHILVSDGRDNAIAVFRYAGPGFPVRYAGLIPTDWYPVNVSPDPQLHRIVVTNDKGIGARGAPSSIGLGTVTVTGHNTYNDTGSVTVFPAPADRQIGELTRRVFVDNGWQRLVEGSPAAAHVPPRAVPARLGQPSTIKHVFLIIKENRTYDQVLGDIGKGDSDPALAQFGAAVTPNQHALSNRFGLFDDFYDVGTLSADGHNWLVQADATDYIEKEFGAFARGYPALGDDALAYQRSGFLWTAARRAGRTVSDFGEYAAKIDLPSTGAPTWSQWYRDSRILEGKAAGPLPVPVGRYRTSSDVPSVNAINEPDFPTFDTDIPDQYRADIWLRDFKKSRRSGKLADLTLIALPQDHTNGVSGRDPYPSAMVADNDLAVGRIVDAISHSRFWANSAIFVLEDDSQNGVDHVDGHRAPLWIASPYARRGVVVSTYYTQINLVKTIEQILGIAPMNQMDRAAVPMTDAFTDDPDPTPFTALPNQVPLDYGVATAAARSPAVPPAETATYRKWVAWSDEQLAAGSARAQDGANPAQHNRLDWYAGTGWRRPYPGDGRILAPDEVPGRDVPSQEIG